MYDDSEDNLILNRKKAKKGSSIIDEEPELTTDIEFGELNYGERIINKFKPGSMINSIFSVYLFSPIVPFFISPCAFSIGGILITIIMLIIIMLFSLLSESLLLRILSEKQFTDYFVILSNYGDKSMIFLNNFSQLFYYFGQIILYMYISYNLLTSGLLHDIPMTNIFKHNEIVLCFFAVVIQFPLSLVKNERVFKITNLINFILAIIIGIFMVVMLIMNGIPDNKDYLYIKPSFEYFLMFSLILLSGFNHLALPDSCKNLRLYSKRRGKSLIIYSRFYQFITFLIFGVLGLFTATTQKCILFFQNIKKIPRVTTAFQTALAVSLQTYISYYCIKIKVCLSIIINKKIYFGGQVGICLISLIVSNIIVILWKEMNIRGIILLICGISVINLGYVIPLWFHARYGHNVSEKKRNNLIVLSLILFLVGIAFSLFGIFYYLVLNYNKQ